MSARWLWVRLHTLPLDSPLAFSTAGEVDDAPAEREKVTLDASGRIPPPKALYDVPLASSFAEVGSFVRGNDLN